jgi:hypothetical protein
MAQQLAKIIQQRKLYATIKGRKYVTIEGWTTCGVMCNVMPREVGVIESSDGTFTATVELVRMSDQVVVGRASSMCGPDETLWKDRPRHMRRSMAITRASSRAFRLVFAWVMKLAGYEGTPAEEMPDTQEGVSSAAPDTRHHEQSNGDLLNTDQQGKLLELVNKSGTPMPTFMAAVEKLTGAQDVSKLNTAQGREFITRMRAKMEKN